MKYRHHFRVSASIEQVAEFHRHSASMPAITPPPILVKVQHAPAVLTDGDEMAFTMWIGPFPMHWVARIEAVSAAGFTDRQLSGPFAEWIHRHHFIAVDEQTTDIVDEIYLRFRPHPVWWLVGVGMWLGLPVLFAYRAWKTKRMLA